LKLNRLVGVILRTQWVQLHPLRCM